MVKYILVSGGVISGIGKGVIASSTGLLLKTYGLKVTSIKIDPYLNIDAGTLSPLDHGEVFVLKDGGEVDLDLGNYERFLDVTLTRDNNITTGKVYRQVIERERKGDYLGKTVQVVPHVTDAIQDWVEEVAKKPVDDSGEEPDVCIIELGGTVGDIESAPFVEAMRQFQFRVGQENFCLIHVSLVPVVGSVGEQKTKPTQSSIRDLRGLGLSPDLIACRSSKFLEDSIKQKISMFCHVPANQVLGVHDVDSVYHVPLLLESQNVIKILEKRLKLDTLGVSPRMKELGQGLWKRWNKLTSRYSRIQDTVTIALVGKYTNLQDSYISVSKSLSHAGLACNCKVEIKWIEATDLEPEMEAVDPIKFHDSWKAVCSANGVLVPGGFGSRGIEGKIAAAKWARENKTPFLGICLGLQVAAIEFARNVVGIKDAESAEFNEEAASPLIVFMPEISKTHMGGTMRLGERPTLFQENTEPSTIRKLYLGEPVALERHRHRYEINPNFVGQLESHGMKFVGRDDTGERMEILELADHPYYVGVQYHPEYLTRPLKPSPPFLGLVLAAAGKLETSIDSIPQFTSHSYETNSD
ncbi:CTP synthase ura7 [Entomophthora muscae]|uniref:CTP synthase ura7 n=1 Tax=Entomophthora muscae TaxID=34485 RepID=A0ACC2SPG2_9FUNG|nr:CTP synthase ura7 [Entomophthora muscae]